MKKLFIEYNFIKRFYVRGTKLSSNPGIQRQIEDLSEKDIHNATAEDFDDIEPNFMNADKSHHNYENEKQAYKEKINYFMVKQKYFKTKNINFLTWSEKEQIKHLYKSDPNEWNVERLSESFPADNITISKIVKSKWMPIDEQRILKHDLSVKNNWKAFEKNEIENLDKELKEHLSKFTKRNNLRAINIPKVVETKEFLKLHQPTNNEFSSIVELNTKKLEGNRIIFNEKFRNNYFLKETHELPITDNKTSKLIVKDNKPVRFSDIKKFSEINNQESNEVEIDNYNDNQIIKLEIDKDVDIMKIKKYNTSISKQHENATDVDSIQDHIKIPRKLWKEGATYKLNDCFYDDDGEFLYRVPGMK